MSNGNNKGVKFLIILVLLALMVSVASLIFAGKMYMDAQGGSNQGGNQPAVKISKKYDKGHSYAKAKSSGKPIVAFFYVDWCGFCQRFAPLFADLVKDKELKKDVSFAYINCEDPKNAELVREYAIDSYPSVFVINKDGQKTKLQNATFFGPDSKEVVTNDILNAIK